MYDALVDELRAHSSEWLRAERARLVGVQRNLHTRELAVLAVLDERGQIDVTRGLGGESARVVRDKVETARALEGLPEIAAVACEGALSDEQLSHVVKVADAESDREWAARAPNVDPLELARIARRAAKPTVEESRARFATRFLRMWWNGQKTMLSVRAELPDVMGAEFEAIVIKTVEQMKPAPGESWESFERRAADALVRLVCDAINGSDDEQPSLGPRPVLQVSVPLEGPAEIAGVPIADELLEQVRANSSIELVVVDDEGAPVTIGKRTPGLSPKKARAVVLRDGKCRVHGCGRRSGLEVHHLVPRSQGGSDDLSNLAAVCPAHHRLLVPHGHLALVGNPNQPDGVELVDLRERPPP